jgi:hypothetical protein
MAWTRTPGWAIFIFLLTTYRAFTMGALSQAVRAECCICGKSLEHATSFAVCGPHAWCRECVTVAVTKAMTNNSCLEISCCESPKTNGFEGVKWISSSSSATSEAHDRELEESESPCRVFCGDPDCGAFLSIRDIFICNASDGILFLCQRPNHDVPVITCGSCHGLWDRSHGKCSLQRQIKEIEDKPVDHWMLNLVTERAGFELTDPVNNFCGVGNAVRIETIFESNWAVPCQLLSYLDDVDNMPTEHLEAWIDQLRRIIPLFNCQDKVRQQWQATECPLTADLPWDGFHIGPLFDGYDSILNRDRRLQWWKERMEHAQRRVEAVARPKRERRFSSHFYTLSTDKIMKRAIEDTAAEWDEKRKKVIDAWAEEDARREKKRQLRIDSPHTSPKPGDLLVAAGEKKTGEENESSDSPH